MKIQYIGKYPAETIGIGTHDIGEIVEVPKELGERLIKQPNWQRPVNPPKKVIKKDKEETK